MTYKDFFRVTIKLLAFFIVLKQLFSIIPQNLPWLWYDFNYKSFIFLISAVATLLFLFYGLIKFTNKIVDGLKLSEGFDEEKILWQNTNNFNLLSLGFIIIGGLLIINNLAEIISYAIKYFQAVNLGNEIYSFEGFDWILRVLKIIFGFAIISKREYFIQLFTTKY